MKINYSKNLCNEKHYGGFFGLTRLFIVITIGLSVVLLAQYWWVTEKTSLVWHLSTWLIMMFIVAFKYCILRKLSVNRDVVEAEVIELNQQLAGRLDELYAENQKYEKAEAEVVRLNEQLMNQVDKLHEEIRKREKAENEQIKLQARLLQAQKMEAIGTLAGGIAHDFNNILSIILGYAELSIASAPEDSDLSKHLQEISGAAKRATSLVRQILCFSRQNKGDSVPMQLSTILKEVLKMIRASLPTTIEIVQNINNEQALILADPTQIHQVLMNLCTNAFQAMEQTGGILGIDLKTVVFNEQELSGHPEAKAGEYIQLSVSDTGKGIDSVIIDRIFEPYFTTKELGQGTGMGLAIVHGIVTGYGGFINVHSDPGKGTSLGIYIPVYHGGGFENDKIAEITFSGCEKILFVDDESLIVSFATRALRELGYDITSTTSSLEALEIFKKNPDLFDLVITDQTMPGLAGGELAQKILEIRSDIPIVICTGFSSIMTSEIAKTIGVKKLVIKPVSISDMSKLIREILDSEKK